MAVTRYAGDRFVIGGSDAEPTGVLDGAYLINTGDLAQKVLKEWLMGGVGRRRGRRHESSYSFKFCSI